MEEEPQRQCFDSCNFLCVVDIVHQLRSCAMIQLIVGNFPATGNRRPVHQTGAAATSCYADSNEGLSKLPFVNRAAASWEIPAAGRPNIFGEIFDEQTVCGQSVVFDDG